MTTPLQVIRKSVWDVRADLTVITTCGAIQASVDKMMMNTGVAFEASRMFPRLPGVAARQSLEAITGYIDKKVVYGFTAFELEGHWLGLFQSKLAWEEPANLALIGFSAVQMRLWMDNNPRFKRVALNFPGQGLIGGLTEAQVLPILSDILDGERVRVHLGPVLGE